MTFLTAGIRAGRARYAFRKKWNWEADSRHKIGLLLCFQKVKENVNRVKRIRCSTMYHKYTQVDNGPTTSNPTKYFSKKEKMMYLVSILCTAVMSTSKAVRSVHFVTYPFSPHTTMLKSRSRVFQDVHTDLAFFGAPFPPFFLSATS